MWSRGPITPLLTSHVQTCNELSDPVDLALLNHDDIFRHAFLVHDNERWFSTGMRCLAWNGEALELRERLVLGVIGHIQDKEGFLVSPRIRWDKATRNPWCFHPTRLSILAILSTASKKVYRE